MPKDTALCPMCGRKMKRVFRSGDELQQTGESVLYGIKFADGTCDSITADGFEIHEGILRFQSAGKTVAILNLAHVVFFVPEVASEQGGERLKVV